MDWGLRIISEYDLHPDGGDIIDQRAILRRLSSMQYTRNDIDFKERLSECEEILLISLQTLNVKQRIELFGDEIERLAWIDPLRRIY